MFQLREMSEEKIESIPSGEYIKFKDKSGVDVRATRLQRERNITRAAEAYALRQVVEAITKLGEETKTFEEFGCKLLGTEVGCESGLLDEFYSAMDEMSKPTPNK